MKKMILSTLFISLCFLVACSGGNSNQNNNTSSANNPTAGPENSAPAAETDVQKGGDLFNARCAACHKVNEDLIGPALQGVDKIRSRQWIYNFVHNSTDVISKGDTSSVNLFNRFKMVQMLSFPDLSTQDIDHIFAYIDAQPSSN
ncbi:MAG: c-type cytochrome [Chitinophagaceae bacterium]